VKNLTEKQNVKKEIIALLDQMAVAFSEKDEAKYLELFAKEHNVVIFGSQAGEKWSDVNEYIISVVNDWKLIEKTNLLYDSVRIDSFDAVAWVAMDVTFTSFMKGQKMVIKGRMTMVFIKEYDEWKITQSHFSMPNRPQA
jgi:ketosteroid isomerase-like protein